MSRTPRNSRSTAVADLERVHRETWAGGDYAAAAAVLDAGPPRDVLDRVGVAAGMEVLDVGTGTGNVALRAAALGCRVVGLDLTSELFATARRRAGWHDVVVDWVEGDAEDLPFEDASFDRVFSAFGVQFTPRHPIAARELARVCRPGGRIGLVNWTPTGQVGELLGITGRRPPAPSAHASPAPLWGDAAHVRALFAGTGVELRFARGHVPWRFASAEHYVAFMETNHGPTRNSRDRLLAEGTWAECRAEIVAMAERRNEATGGGLLMHAEYLVVIGTRSRVLHGCPLRGSPVL